MIEKIFLFAKGFGMGAANIIPGVSGGTIALITGIYERLISALHNFDYHAVKLFLKFKFKKLYEKVDGGFLALILLGVVVSTFTLAKLMKYLLEYHETLLLAFFFGLILASIIIVMKRVKNWNVLIFFWFIIGAITAYLITSSKSMNTPDTALYIFLSGFIAIIAMILPGISGSYILLILGKYKFAIELVSSITSYFKNVVVGVFNGDFSKAVSLFPASDIIWPWKIVIDTYIDPRGVEKKVQENIFPTEIDQMFFYIIVYIVVGFVAVYLIEKFSHPSSKKKT
jgi:putative membrane protein